VPVVGRLVLALSLFLYMVGIAEAEPRQVFAIDLPSQSVADALNGLSEQTGVAVVFPYDLAKDRKAHPVAGRYTLLGALSALLQDTGLSGGLSDKGVLTISLSKSRTNTTGETFVRQNDNNKDSRPFKVHRTAGIAAFFASMASAFSTAAHGAADASAADSATLDEVVVQAFTSPAVRSATKLDIPVVEVPVSVTSYSAAFLQAIETDQISDTYRYMTGLQRSGGTGYDMNLRGFSTASTDKNAILTDGLPGLTVRWGSPPTLATDHLELVRGPLAVLYGQGQPGGFINVITKKPEEQAKSEFGLSASLAGIGHSDAAGGRAMADVTGPLNDARTVLARLIVEGVYRDSWRDFDYEHSSFVAPSVTWFPADRTDVTLQMEGRTTRVSDYIGLVAPKNNIDLITRRLATSYQNPGDALREQGLAIQAQLHHDFGGGIKFSFNVRDVHHHDDSSGYENVNVTNNYQDVVRQLFRKKNFRQYDFADANLIIPFDTGPVSHQTIVGLSGGREFLDTTRLQNVTSSAAFPSLSIDLYDPDNGRYNYSTVLPPSAYPLCGTGAPGTITGNGCNIGLYDQRVENYSQAAYLSDMATLTSQWKLLLSVRFDHESQHFTQNALQPIAGAISPSLDRRWDVDAVVPMASVVYEPIRNWSLYTTYSKGFVPQNGNVVDVTGAILSTPSNSRELEVGSKAELFDRHLNATFALFDIQKENAPVGVACGPLAPAGSSCSELSTTRSRGAELEVDALILPQWRIIAGHSLIDARIKSSPDPVSVGAPTTNTPHNSLHMWTRYDIASGRFAGLSFGLGEIWVGSRSGTTPTTNGACTAFNGQACFNSTALVLPSYASTDLAIYYDVNSFNVTLKVNNVFDRTYYTSTQNASGVKVQPGDPLTAMLTGRVRF
jgi:iron complex outermembrane receptor protein